ncbi:MAG: RNA-directed DNA polymerase, partial [Thermosynechococcaceae cyanobacterium]
IYASRLAQRGKRFRENVLSFNYRLEQNLHRLQTELQSKTYRPGSYRSFRIFDPKPRLISAAPYRDRVVHHALCNVIVPLMERSFIGTSYANRTGYGTHRALRKFTEYARTSRYVLQCDIRKYFPSIDRTILKTIVLGKIKCADTLWLIDAIIDGGNAQEPVLDYFPGDDLLTPVQRPKGLPIGNLTSQFLANVYLNPFDHFVKEQLGCDYYLRYVDDFALFSDDKSQLAEARNRIEPYLATLRLTIHPIKSQLFATQYGANFVGFRILPERIRVRNDNLRRGRLRLKRLQRDYRRGRIAFPKLIQRLRSWEAHLMHGNTYRLRHTLFRQLRIQQDSIIPMEKTIVIRRNP